MEVHDRKLKTKAEFAKKYKPHTYMKNILALNVK